MSDAIITNDAKPVIRLIQAKDNAAVKQLVHDVLIEHGISGEGFAGVDPEMDDMFSAYQGPLTAYFVIEQAGEIVGSGGFAPLAGCEGEGIAELRKMYLRPGLRGQGWGHRLMIKCIEGARQAGFKQMYLETTPAMKAAQKLYLKHGFNYRETRLGDTGHGGCEVLMSRHLRGQRTDD
jgi:putative acetyltransferase